MYGIVGNQQSCYAVARSLQNDDYFNYDLALTHTFGKWEVGMIAYGSTDFGGYNAGYSASASTTGLARQSQFALGGLMGYNFGPVIMQFIVSTDVYTQNYTDQADPGPGCTSSSRSGTRKPRRPSSPSTDLLISLADLRTGSTIADDGSPSSAFFLPGAARSDSARRRRERRRGFKIEAREQRRFSPAASSSNIHKGVARRLSRHGRGMRPMERRSRGKLFAMLIHFFTSLREAQIPVSLREYLTLCQALSADLAEKSVEEFYFLARACLVKDERNLDKFDRVFGAVFKGLESGADSPQKAEIPADWLKKLAEKFLTEEEKKEIEALGWDKLMETLKKRLEEQKGRHQGGNKWIGTGGTSPFGAYGYNPEGIRIGQDGNRNFRAVKVWDKREFKDLDGDEELGPRNIKIALRRLRKFARTGAAEELDLDGTIGATARQGFLDLKLRPERRNAVKVLLLLDIGGSMDWHVEQVESLFAAARSEFKHLEHFYFHNCLYESVWKNNQRRHSERTGDLGPAAHLSARLQADLRRRRRR